KYITALFNRISLSKGHAADGGVDHESFFRKQSYSRLVREDIDHVCIPSKGPLPLSFLEMQLFETQRPRVYVDTLEVVDEDG
ncbi:unnamed protein product, partial [Amoebophrya sp. A25]